MGAGQVPVPEATVDEDDRLMPREDNVRPPRQASSSEDEAEASRMEKGPDG